MLLQRKVTKEKSPQKPTESFICRTNLRLQAMKLSVRTFRGRPRTQKPVGRLIHAIPLPLLADDVKINLSLSILPPAPG